MTQKLAQSMLVSVVLAVVTLYFVSQLETDLFHFIESKNTSSMNMCMECCGK